MNIIESSRERSSSVRRARVAHRTVLIALVLVGLVAAAPVAGAAAPPMPDLIATYDPGGLDLGEGVALGADGGAYVVGVAEREGQQDMVTVKFNSTGHVEWARLVDEGDKDRGGAVVVDASGNVYAAGTVNSGGGDNVIVRKYDPRGEEVWTARFDKGTAETARAIALDPDGNVVVAGASLSQNGGDGFVAKFSPTGEELWSKPINVFWLDEGFAVATDGDGNIVVAGRVLNDGSFDVLVRKFAPSGSVLWTKYVSTPGREEARGVAADEDGNVYVSGTTTTERGNESSTDVLVARFSAAGDLDWSRTVDVSGGDDEGRGAATDRAGNVYVTGFGRFDGNKDPFLLKFTPDGDEVWRHRTRGSGIDGTGPIAVSKDGARIALAGATQREGPNFDFLLVTYAQRLPTAAFVLGTPDPKAGAPVAFEDASSPGDSPIVSWAWSFGDGTTSTAQNPETTYAYGGTYAVRLVVRDAQNNLGEATLTVRVDGPPPPPQGNAGSAGDDTPAPTSGDDPEPTDTRPSRWIPAAPAAFALVALAASALVCGRRRE